MKESVTEVFELLFTRYPDLLPIKQDIEKSFEILVSIYTQKKLLLVCGNGGSAADSEHVLSELMKNFTVTRSLTECEKEALINTGCSEFVDTLEGALPAISLVSQSAIMTAFANDVTADSLFAQQVYGYRDVAGALLAISTSGNSENVLRACKVAKAFGIQVIGLTGRDGGKLVSVADCTIVVPRIETYQIQELHLPIYHSLCAMLETHFFLEK